MGLCRIDDDTKEKWSFQELKKYINKSGYEASFVSEINKKVADYRAKINGVKVNHRNSYIAHSTKKTYQNQFPTKMELSKELLGCVLFAIDVGDFIAGERMEYIWGAPESTEYTDLRKYLEDIFT